MYKIILSFVFLSVIISCKNFNGQINVNNGKIIPIKIVQDDLFYDNDDENGENSESFKEEINFDLKPGYYSTVLNFSGNKNLSLEIKANNEEYTLNIALDKSFPDISTEGDHKFFVTSKELKQVWSLETNINTQFNSGPLIENVEFCSVRIREWRCSYRKDHSKDYSKNRRPNYYKTNQSCYWVYYNESGKRNVEYYNKTANYEVFANIVYDATNSKKAPTAKLSGILGSYTSKKIENTKIYSYRSCCYSNYSNRCLEYL